jgi:hypothetical protein
MAAAPLTDPESQHQPRILGNKAMMVIIYYAPKTLEITYTESFLWPDAATCQNSIEMALQIVMPYASEGDLVAAHCETISPPERVKKKGEADL